MIDGHPFEAESDLQHKMGQAEGDGRSVAPGGAADHLIFGPYATDWGEHAAQAVHWIATDAVAPSDQVVVTLEVNDAAQDQVLSSRVLRRGDFRSAGGYERFPVNVDLSGREGHAMETCVYWPAHACVRVDRIVVNVAEDGGWRTRWACVGKGLSSEHIFFLCDPIILTSSRLRDCGFACNPTCFRSPAPRPPDGTELDIRGATLPRAGCERGST